MRNNTDQHRQRIYSRHLIILCALLGCGSSSTLLAAGDEEHRSPWAQHITTDSHTPQPPTPARESTPAVKTQANPQQRQIHEFNQAFEQLKAAKYSNAIAAFKQFIQRYPQSEYRAEVHYWIGEAHYLAKDYPRALAQFSHIMIYFADSEFARQALLKSADTFTAMQDMPQAKLFYQRVIKNHPRTSYAAKATEQLRQLNR